MGVALLDSSAVIGYLDRSDLLHADAVATIERTVKGGRGLAVSAISWTELLYGAGLGHRDETVVREFVDDFGVRILAADARVAERAAEIQRSGRLRTPDALILAAADVDQDVDLVICGDAKWRGVRGLQARIRLIHSTSQPK